MPDSGGRGFESKDNEVTGLPGPTTDAPDDLFRIIGGHPLSEVATLLGEHLGIGVDRISLMMILSAAAGRLGIPVNLVIISDDPGAELMISEKVTNIVPETVKRIDNIKQFRNLVDGAFDRTEVVLLRSLHEPLFRYACEAASKDTATVSPPSVWLISDRQPDSPRLGPTLFLMARQTDRSLVGFGHQFSRLLGTQINPAYSDLASILDQLNHRRQYDCPFRHQLLAEIKPSDSLIMHRLLVTIAALRLQLSVIKCDSQHESDSFITIEDYRVTRDLLNALPIPGELSTLSPYAAETGRVLFEAFQGNSSYQFTLPDNNDFGRKVFTRPSAVAITGLSYNTVKDHLKQLVAEGIVEERTVSELRTHSRVRRQGLHVYYRFANSRTPPFCSRNPFSRLPQAKEIAET